VHACAVSLVFIGGSSLVCAEARFLCSIIAFIFIIIAYVATNLVKLDISGQGLSPQSAKADSLSGLS
jgi:hypothetical protein